MLVAGNSIVLEYYLFVVLYIKKQITFHQVIGQDGFDNWRVQASFGISWGEFGTSRIASGNTCGLQFFL
ncbi:unnamed protein product [Paramecium pentaurelia]|uniref:Uncharacterized protein n=1 Tax=Paramecium pentaurelia TaxID=43138 RepID=A0A8S1XJ58_9CILI|nr:unnamed protein product [Paramecium pentaurelia]